MLTVERVRELFDCDLEKGVLRYRQNCGKCTGGEVAGYHHGNGYLRIGIDNKKYFIHRIIWFVAHGKWPDHFLDHKNLNTSDNRLENLREATQSQNSMNRGTAKNNTSGFRGVGFYKRHRKFTAIIKVAQKSIHLGYFATFEEAKAARIAAADKYHGEFARIGELT